MKIYTVNVSFHYVNNVTDRLCTYVFYAFSVNFYNQNRSEEKTYKIYYPVRNQQQYICFTNLSINV